MKILLKKPAANSHKGDNGKLLIIAGSKKYSGAPVFSLLAARRFVDLLYFYPGENDPFLIQAVKNIPEVIVIEKDELNETILKCDCVLFGIGISRAKFDISLLKSAKKLIIDGDGFRYFEEINSFRKSKGYEEAELILTPHEAEFQRLFNCESTEKNVLEMAEKNNCLILKKGPVDIISNGKVIELNKIHNQGMTKGGTGDVLAGLVAALACTNDSLVSMVRGARINGAAGNLLKKKYGYWYCASDLADSLAESRKNIEW